MRRALFAAGAVLVLCAPALADQVTITRQTVTRSTSAPDNTVSTVVAPAPSPPAEIPRPPQVPTVTIAPDRPPPRAEIPPPALAPSGGTVPTVVVAPDRPPPPRAEIPPPAPGPGLAWVPGHWTWSLEQRDFVWLHGRYMDVPYVNAAWVPGQWVEREQGWVWEDGHWD